MSYHLGSVDTGQRAELYADDHDQEPRPRSRKLLATAIALLVMGVFAGGLWFAYVQGMRHASGGGDVPLIRADERPTKVKPEKPGGMEIPDRDKLIYTQKRAGVEHLLAAPEKPMPRPTSSSGTPTHAEASPPPAATAPAPTTPSAPVASSATTPVTLSASATTATATRSQQPPTTSAPAKPAAANSPSTKTGGTRLQLGSVHNEDAARREWDRIKQTNSDLLGSLSAAPVRADLGDKGVFYRVQTGPVADADRICTELKRRNIGCIIAR